MNKDYKFYLILFIIYLVTTSSSFATHNMGKDLSYHYLGMNGTDLQYEVVLHFYRNCWDNPFGGQAAQAPASITLDILNQCTNAKFSATMLQDVSGVCPNASGCIVPSLICNLSQNQTGCGWVGSGNPPFPGVEVYVYKCIIDLPMGCSSILLGVTDCCRNNAISNLPSPGSLFGSIMASINTNLDPNTGFPYLNNSSLFSISPIVFICRSFPVEYNQGAVDIDGDSLVYSLVNPLQGDSLPYTDINFNTGRSATYPVQTIPVSNFGFDSQTGQMSFTPANTEQDVIDVKVSEYRNGILVGSTMRDMQIVIINCNQTSVEIDTITSIQNGVADSKSSVLTCPGSQLSFSILCKDNNHSNITVLSTLTSTPSPIPMAIFDTSRVGVAPFDTVYANISWLPTLADTGCHYFQLSVENEGCPVKGSQTKTFRICVTDNVRVTPHDATYCGTPVILSSTVGYNINWSPSQGLSSINSLSTSASPLSDTKYTFNSSCGSDTVFVKVLPKWNIYAGDSQEICQGEVINFSPLVDSSFAPFKIKWTPSLNLYDPISGLPSDSILSPSIKANTSQSFVLTTFADNGCEAKDTMFISVSPLYNNTNFDTICYGNSLAFNGMNLTASGVYSDTLQTILGCDSVVSMQLFVRPYNIQFFSDSVCNGQGYYFNNQLLTSSGIYFDTLLSPQNCDLVLSLSLVVIPCYAPYIQQNGSVLFTQKFKSYQWLMNGVSVSGANNQEFIVTQSGSYQVVVMQEYGRIDTSSIFEVTSLGLIDEKTSKNVCFFPNPASDEVWINIDRLEGNVNFVLYDMSGRVCKTQQLKSKYSVINFSDIPQGIYTVQIYSSGYCNVSRLEIVK